jgi:two-component system sensor histidine kinase HydH
MVASMSSSEDQLRAQYTEIAVLAGALAHEIKNPLSTISLNIELLAEDFSEAATPRERRALERIGRVQKECQRLTTLLNDFLGFARPRPLRRGEVDINRLIEELLDFFSPQARDANIEIVRLLDPNLPSVLIDREQMRSVLHNLVLNAQQAMPGGGRLEVRTRRVPEGLAVDLIDTGCGMTEETLSHIFEAFWSTKGGGTGLGLPTAKKILEAHGGKIFVQSEPGRGTQFTIQLPTTQVAPLKSDEA